MAGTGGKQRGIRLRWMMILMAVLAGLLTALLFLIGMITVSVWCILPALLILPAAVKKAIVISTSDGKKVWFYCSRRDPHKEFVEMVVGK